MSHVVKDKYLFFNPKESFYCTVNQIRGDFRFQIFLESFRKHRSHQQSKDWKCDDWSSRIISLLNLAGEVSCAMIIFIAIIGSAVANPDFFILKYIYLLKPEQKYFQQRRNNYLTKTVAFLQVLLYGDFPHSRIIWLVSLASWKICLFRFFQRKARLTWCEKETCVLLSSVTSFFGLGSACAFLTFEGNAWKR